jgi:hypothetical protein
MLVAILIGDYRTRQALELLAGLVLAALLFHFLVDRALELVSVVRARVPLGSAVLDRLERLFGRTDGGEPRFHWLIVPWRALPLLLLTAALYASFVADGGDRWLSVLLPLLLAAVLFVLPGGLAGGATAKARPEPGAVAARSSRRASRSPQPAWSACWSCSHARSRGWLR